MYPCVRRFSQPFLYIGIGLLKGTIRVSSPEAFPDVLNGALCLSLYPGGVERAQARVKLVVVGKTGKLDVEGRFAV